MLYLLKRSERTDRDSVWQVRALQGKHEQRSGLAFIFDESFKASIKHFKSSLTELVELLCCLVAFGWVSAWAISLTLHKCQKIFDCLRRGYVVPHIERTAITIENCFELARVTKRLNSYFNLRSTDGRSYIRTLRV